MDQEIHIFQRKENAVIGGQKVYGLSGFPIYKIVTEIESVTNVVDLFAVVWYDFSIDNCPTKIGI